MSLVQPRREFGDFQTPDSLAANCVAKLSTLGANPRSIVEPTCGRGSFLAAAARQFPDSASLFGLEIDPGYASEAKLRLSEFTGAEIAVADFFDFGWSNLIARLQKPLLVVGNPPWITSAELGTLGSRNLPAKQALPGSKGIDSVTGKANFDISEWMIQRNLEWLTTDGDTLAVLCKTVVARKTLATAWKQGRSFSSARMYLIDAKREFDASVDACLLVLSVGAPNLKQAKECDVYQSLDSEVPVQTIAWRRGRLVADARLYDANAEWLSVGADVDWRSGIKHDCSRIMELEVEGESLRNSTGEFVDVEPDLLYPMLKSSEVHRGLRSPGKLMLVPQRAVGESTSWIRTELPRTWAYLEAHADAFDGRRSAIYAKGPRFSIFGVGPYSFTDWKIAISALYKDLAFQMYGPREGRPIVFDDTVNLLACDSEDVAQGLIRTINSPPAQELFQALVFWDNKRPLSVDVLRNVDLWSLGCALGYLDQARSRLVPKHRSKQASLF